MANLMEAAERKTREYDFTNEDFERVRKLIYEHAGISLSASKQDMVYSRLARRLREKGLTRFADYLRQLEAGDTNEWQAFTNALTTNLTSFYREAHHFPILAEHLMRRRRAGGGPFTVWCCAASTGEEPYTIAMAAIEALNDSAPPVRILATDVDTNVLAKADAGIYDIERIESLAPERARRFFLRGDGSRAGNVKVRPELRKLITFGRLNLLDTQWPVRGPFDVIMCRNVMIYFDKDTQRRILEKFAPLLRSDGLLFAGHSESFLQSADLFKLRGKTVYGLAAKAQVRHG
ncbi:MCP methyltransferase, CheR-type [Nitrosospira sp. Nl5]|uniref:CheR family methyltransferase n=1 Tax=Nitrosospira sp. Nl5 TaxID=200120 RepID=UPI00088E05ED|nr:CheR family methyltransferase [Nitrosospira sp. Nl5]SCY07296.1 MCP methyltransferase, CheR-type [Nitrosospira sp. Nl5]